MTTNAAPLVAANPQTQPTPRHVLVDSNAVLVANELNLSIFKPSWLQNAGILTEQELSGQIVITPGLAQIPTDLFELVIIPNRVQITFRPAGLVTARAILTRIIGGIATTLPHTPYQALGINYQYHIGPPQGTEFGRWDRQLFALPAVCTIVQADDTKARFGAYFSLDALGMRVKVDLKPVVAQLNDPQGRRLAETELINAALNYHTQLPDADRLPMLLSTLAKWDEAFQHAATIIQSIQGWATVK